MSTLSDVYARSPVRQTVYLDSTEGSVGAPLIPACVYVADMRSRILPTPSPRMTTLHSSPSPGRCLYIPCCSRHPSSSKISDSPVALSLHRPLTPSRLDGSPEPKSALRCPTPTPPLLQSYCSSVSGRLVVTSCTRCSSAKAAWWP